jgi:hypothetical protein
VNVDGCKTANRDGVWNSKRFYEGGDGGGGGPSSSLSS